MSNHKHLQWLSLLLVLAIFAQLEGCAERTKSNAEEGIQVRITASPDDEFRVGQVAENILTIWNTGRASQTIDGINLGCGCQGVYDQEEKLIANDQRIVLQPRKEVHWKLRTTVGEGKKVYTVELVTSDSAEPKKTIHVTITGRRDLECSPPAWDIGDVDSFEGLSKHFTVRHRAGLPIKVEAVASSNGLSVIGDQVTPSEVRLTVKVSSGKIGYLGDSITITDGPEKAIIAVTGRMREDCELDAYVIYLKTDAGLWKGSVGVKSRPGISITNVQCVEPVEWREVNEQLVIEAPWSDVRRVKSAHARIGFSTGVWKELLLIARP